MDKRISTICFAWALIATALLIGTFFYPNGRCPYKWHGGNPLFKGSCWCGFDQYCLCTPSLAIDAIIEVYDESGREENINIVLVHRRDPPKDLFAIPGGFVDVGETVEDATIREVKEETNLDLLNLEQFRVFSDPKRDKRRHTVSSVFRCRAKNVLDLRKGDDAKSVVVVPLRDILALNLAFDHREILAEYIQRYHPTLAAPPTEL